MTILTVAYPLLPAGPDSAGGAEQVLHLVERGIVAAGHRSLVIAAAGSIVSGELLKTASYLEEDTPRGFCHNSRPESLFSSRKITEDLQAQAQRAHRYHIEQALADQKIDLIHFHGLDFHAYLSATRIPMLATLHLPLAWYPSQIFHLPGVVLNCVSQAQAASAPDDLRLPVICNGIDVSHYYGNPSRQEFLLWLGRVCPEKGAHIALEIAHRLKRELILAGPVHPFPDHERYFTECVQPLLDSKRRYVGAVGRQTKIELLAHASCVLIPSQVPETSSLVAMEAAASGTPVVAAKLGALPEVIERGVTGFLAGSTEEMMEYVQRSAEISPQACRERACEQFSAERMVKDYLALYQTLLQNECCVPGLSR